MESTIEKNIGETLYRDLFYPCKTLLFQSKGGHKRRFVEYSEATNFGTEIYANTDELELAVSNAVRKLLLEGNDDFFFDKNDVDVKGPIFVGNDEYWVRFIDLTERWTNHFWTRSKVPLIGFKTVSEDYRSVWALRTGRENNSLHYSIGETYSVDEEKFLENGCGFFFSPQLKKALNYAENGAKTLLVVVHGLLLIKNCWDDICASNLTIVKELSSEEMRLFNQDVHKPSAFWNGFKWNSQNNMEI